MPPLYLNTEVGSCDTEIRAVECITKTMGAYSAFKKHVTQVYQEKNGLSQLKLCSELGKASFIGEFLPKLDKKTRENVIIFMQELGKGEIVSFPAESMWTLKTLDVESPFLEYVLKQNGMALSFASDAYWQRDFIEFNESTETIPNIWGQADFRVFELWLEQWKKQNRTIFSQIQADFNVAFCDTNVTEDTFFLHEWKMIYEAFRKAHALDFAKNDPFIKKWGGLPIFYVRDKIESSFSLRIFFVKKPSKIYVGAIYHKNESNTRKEAVAAEKSYKLFQGLGILE